jgi:hypothetical protein
MDSKKDENVPDLASEVINSIDAVIAEGAASYNEKLVSSMGAVSIKNMTDAEVCYYSMLYHLNIFYKCNEWLFVSILYSTRFLHLHVDLSIDSRKRS